MHSILNTTNSSELKKIYSNRPTSATFCPDNLHVYTMIPTFVAIMSYCRLEYYTFYHQMNKLYSLFSTVLLSFSAVQLQAQTRLSNLIERDYSGRADTLDYVLTNQFLNTTKGVFYAIPRSNSNAALGVFLLS